MNDKSKRRDNGSRRRKGGTVNDKTKHHDNDSRRQVRELWQPVIKELISARLNFPNWPNDPLHAAAILHEEAGELMKAVLEHTYEPYKSSREDVRKEAIQTAAMCFRFLASFDRYDFAPCIQHRQDK